MTKTIFVQLLNEGSVAYRPAIAEELSDGSYRILMPSDYDPEDEEWEFLPGDIVRCLSEQLSGCDCLVARERVR